MLFLHQSKTGNTSDMISPLYVYPSLNNLLPIRFFNSCKDVVIKRSCTIALFAVLMLCIISSPCAGETINPDSTTANPFINWHRYPRCLPHPLPSRINIFLRHSACQHRHYLIKRNPARWSPVYLTSPQTQMKGKNNAAPTPKCQGAIKQLGLFITSWNKGPQRQDHHFCWMLTEDCFYPHKKFPVDLYHNVVTTCAIGKGSAWKAKTHNLRCSDQLQSLKESADKLIAAVAVTKRYPPSHPIWKETEEDCRNYGLCEFQLESTRHAVINSYSKTRAACNIN